MSSQFSQVKNYAGIVLTTRKLISLTKFSIATSIFLTGLGYYSLISDYFQPNDPTNLSIMNALTDKDYKSITSSTIDILEKYNNGESEVKPSGDYYAFVPTRFNAMTVHIHGELKPELPNTLTTTSHPVKYRYNTTYRISISPMSLTLFLSLELLFIFAFTYLQFNIKSKYENKFDDKIINSYYNMLASPLNRTEHSDIEKLKSILGKFYSFQLNMNSRYNNRRGLTIDDEYDVQDLLRAILALHYDDVNAESTVPYQLGSNSRVDFLIRDIGIAIEVKKTSKSVRDSKLAEQIITDVHRYSSHPFCKDVIFFIYDPEHFIKNPAGLQNDLEKINCEITPHIIVSPSV
ncbi:PD-(D/E)XK nuclease domain-containing protein [Klebsiella aerogenes]